MNWHNTLNEIYSKLNACGYSEISTDIHEGQLSGGTGGEIFDIIISKLIAIKTNKPHVYIIIKVEIDSIIEYGKSIGYLIK
ncbi:MAG: hypothetical protein ABIR06_04655 [Cyclobacteriaceae bacterium]